jgi:hypothetical protein
VLHYDVETIPPERVVTASSIWSTARAFLIINYTPFSIHFGRTLSNSTANGFLRRESCGSQDQRRPDSSIQGQSRWPMLLDSSRERTQEANSSRFLLCLE